VIADNFDNPMMKFIVNNRADAWKADVNIFVFFAITNCQNVHSHSLSVSLSHKL